MHRCTDRRMEAITISPSKKSWGLQGLEKQTCEPKSVIILKTDIKVFNEQNTAFNCF